MAITRHYTVAQLKSKILQPALSSVYMVDITSGTLKLGDFFNARGINSNSFELINLSCSDASLPGASLATHEVTSDFAGVTEKMAYRKIYDETLDLTFYVDSNYIVLEFLNSWMSYVVGEGSTFGREVYLDPTAYYRMNWPKNYKANISITKFEKNRGNQTSVTYDIIDAFPTNIISTPVSYEASQLLKVTASFTYTRHVMRRSSVPVDSIIPESVPQTPEEQAYFNGSGNPEFFNPQFGVQSQENLREDYAAWALSNQTMIEKFGRTSADPNNNQKLILQRAQTEFPAGSPQLAQLKSKYKF